MKLGFWGRGIWRWLCGAGLFIRAAQGTSSPTHPGSSGWSFFARGSNPFSSTTCVYLFLPFCFPVTLHRWWLWYNLWKVWRCEKIAWKSCSFQANTKEKMSNLMAFPTKNLPPASYLFPAWGLTLTCRCWWEAFLEEACPNPQTSKSTILSSFDG